MTPIRQFKKLLIRFTATYSIMSNKPSLQNLIWCPPQLTELTKSSWESRPAKRGNGSLREISHIPYKSVLRKENFIYDIIPFKSNVPLHFKLMAGRSYFHTTRSHTNSRFKLKNQLKVVHTILKLKGFPIWLIKQMSTSVLRTISKTDSAKKFLGTTTFDKIGLRHSFVTQVFTDSSINQ